MSKHPSNIRRQQIKRILFLTPGEEKIINDHEKEFRRKVYSNNRRIDHRNLENVEVVQQLKRIRHVSGGKITITGRGVLPLIGRLRRMFPADVIQVLDEGAGRSSFAQELTDLSNRHFGVGAVHVLRTDLRIKDEFGRPLHVIQSTPEQLLKKFGASRFHLIFSTYGGLAHTQLSVIKGFSNIFAVLKPGGEARIILEPFSRSGMRINECLQALQELSSYFPTLRFAIDTGGRDYLIRIKKKRMLKR